MQSLAWTGRVKLGIVGLSWALAWGTLGEAPAFDPAAPFKPDNLFLTWRGDPLTTMVIQWFGDKEQPEKPVLWVRGKDDAEWKSNEGTRVPFPKTDLFLYRAELTGLTADTDYFFHIGLSSPEYRFKTAPADLKRPLVYACGGDAGVRKSAEEVNREIGKQDPLFALIGGDIAYDNALQPLLWIKFFKQYHEHLKTPSGRLVPLLAGIGNHEVVGGFGQTPAKSTFFYTTFNMYKEHAYAVIDFAKYLSIVFLDTNHTAPIAGEQTEWLSKILAERKDVPHVFVYYHVPAYPSVRPFGVGELQRKHWCPLFEKHGVDAVFEHHDHAFKRTHPIRDNKIDPKGIVYFGDGAWGQLRMPKKVETTWYLAAAEGVNHFFLNRLHGSERSHVAISNTGRVIDVYPTLRKRSDGAPDAAAAFPKSAPDHAPGSAPDSAPDSAPGKPSN